MLESRLALERPRLSWPTAVVALSIATFAFLVPLVLGVVSLGELVHSDASLVLITPVVAILAAGTARRPLTRIALIAALMGTAAGLLFLGNRSILTATSFNDEIVPRDLIAVTEASYRRTLRVEEADLALLQHGLTAAQSRRPLPAPEGGLLVPVASGNMSGYDSQLRYEAVSANNVAPRWEEALREQRGKVAETRLRATMSYRDSAAAWTRRAALSLAWSMALGLIVSLAALFGRTLFGASR